MTSNRGNITFTRTPERELKTVWWKYTHSRTACVGTQEKLSLCFFKKKLVDIKGNYQAVSLTQTKENVFQTMIS